MIKIVSLVLALISSSALAGYYFQPETLFLGGRGPCDLVACAEAWSVTRGMSLAYSGPLFQLSNGVTTLDIGQVNHKADMSTWSAFCSGVASNCTFSKIYAQINKTSNDLTPFNSGNKATFTIETATGLPLFISFNTTTTSAGGQQYAIGGATDSAATGINALGTAETVLLNALPVEQPNGWCCGHFGTAHIFNCCASTGGGDFMIGAAWGAVGSPPLNACGSLHTFCVAADFECCYTPNALIDQVDYSATQFPGAVFVLTYDPTPNKASWYVNSVQVTNQTPSCSAAATPPCTMNSGQRVHYGGGGDLTGPEKVAAREMLITNTALNQTQVTTIFKNTTSFYSTLNFPSGVSHPATYAAGPGDVVTGSRYFNGFRAYTAAIAAAGTQQIIKVEQTNTGNSCGILPNAAGGLGQTTNCSNAGDNGQTIQAFCSAITNSGATGGPGTNCTVLEVFDQTNSGADYQWLGVFAAQPIFAQYCINFTPCAVLQNNTIFGATITLGAVAQPYTAVAVAQRSDIVQPSQVITHEDGSSASFFLGFATAANAVTMITESGGSFPTGTFPTILATAKDDTTHALYGIFNAASSSLVVDGVATTGTVGSDAAGANPVIRWGMDGGGGAQFLNGQIAETGLYPFGLTNAQQSNLVANQRAYWGF